MVYDNFGIPIRLFTISNDELPETIGLVVMLSSLLEFKIGHIAFCLENALPEKFSSKVVTVNIATIKKRLIQLNAENIDPESIERIKTFVLDVEIAMEKRNKLIHSVWNPGSSRTMIGYLGVRKGKLKSGIDPIEYSEYSPEILTEMKEDLILLASRADEIVSTAASLGAVIYG